MQDAARLEEQFSIIAETERTTAPLRVLKQGDSFAVFDQYGDIIAAEAGEQGLYHDGTRFLSRLELLLLRKRPLFLSSKVSDDNVVFTADLTNPDVRRNGVIAIPRGELHLSRSRVLWDGSCLERIRIANYALHPVEMPITLLFDADFADVFEVRGTRRARRGEQLPESTGADSLLQYRGLDGVERRSRLRWNPRPDLLEPGRATFIVRLPPHGAAEIELNVSYEVEQQHRNLGSFESAREQARAVLSTRAGDWCTVVSSNESLNRWIRRSAADLQMM